MFRTGFALPEGIQGLFETPLPPDILQAVEDLERDHQSEWLARKIAVFDLDNTLLVGDIGDAVFASLLQQGSIRIVSWSEYRGLLETNPIEALTSVVTSMSGLTEAHVQRTTLALLSRGGTYLEWDRASIPIPYAHPAMRQLVSLLRRHGYQVHVISASNEISARLAAWRLFGIPPFNVFGLRQRIEQGKLTGKILDPVPFDGGKEKVYREFIGNKAPIISAGDSFFDIPLLRMTDPRGFSIWVGEEKREFEFAQRRIDVGSRFLFLQRRSGLEIDEQRVDA